MALKHWVDFFDELQHIRGRSKNTVMAYRRDLELYDRYLSSSGGDIAGFYNFMKKNDLSTRSQARVVSSLRTYFKFCEAKGENAPELRDLRPPKIKAALPKVLAYDEFQQLLKACEAENPFRSARNHITLMLLFGLGCRVSELIGLNLEDFNQTESWLSVLGKGGKQRIIPLTERLAQDLKDYLKEVRPTLAKDTSRSILINDRGHRPSRVDIWRWLAAWSRKAGFEEVVNPHKFRHGCATALLESGADLKTIQMLLGHASLQTTQIYTTVTTQRLAETIDNHHPLSEFTLNPHPAPERDQ